ncbi:MAG: hypothetical protein MRY64_15540 [Hyphomonadaceae bacterium]|nr:hypothetical protein [Hyphomonadaceae bacterium]
MRCWLAICTTAFVVTCLSVLAKPKLAAADAALMPCGSSTYLFSNNDSIYELIVADSELLIRYIDGDGPEFKVPLQTDLRSELLLSGDRWRDHYITRHKDYLFIDDSLPNLGQYAFLRVDLNSGSHTRHVIPTSGKTRRSRLPTALAASRIGSKWIFPISLFETAIVDLSSTSTELEYEILPFRTRGLWIGDEASGSSDRLLLYADDPSVGFRYMFNEQPLNIDVPSVSAVFPVKDNSFSEKAQAIEVAELGDKQVGRSSGYYFGRQFFIGDDNLEIGYSVDVNFSSFEYDGVKSRFLWLQKSGTSEFFGGNEQLIEVLNGFVESGWHYVNIVDVNEVGDRYIIRVSKPGEKAIYYLDARAENAGVLNICFD